MPSTRRDGLPHTTLHQPPYSDQLPAELVFRSAQMPPLASFPKHRHAWGEFVYSFSGVMEVRMADQHCIAPPQFGIWLPPQVEHVGLNREAAHFSSLYVASERCAHLPRQACALAVSPLVRALLDHLRQHPPGLPQTAEDQRLMQVVVDQLAHARSVTSYLPQSDDPVLGALLRHLQAQPGDERSLAELAAAFHSTERTLSRRCQRELGMGFAEWRQRLCVVKALPRLAAGDTVEAIALDLGYASASPFIAMFRRLTGQTPDEQRRQGAQALMQAVS